jgi:hypothetical protein
MTRRQFVGRTLAAGVVSAAPAFLRGQNLNSKLNIAFIACGGRGNASLNELTNAPGRSAGGGGKQGRAPDPNAGPHPDENVTVLCDVNQLALDSASQRYPQAKKFTDLRRVFDRPNDFDAVVVSTAEHTHVFATSIARSRSLTIFGKRVSSARPRQSFRSCPLRWATRDTPHLSGG